MAGNNPFSSLVRSGASQGDVDIESLLQRLSGAPTADTQTEQDILRAAAAGSLQQRGELGPLSTPLMQGLSDEAKVRLLEKDLDESEQEGKKASAVKKVIKSLEDLRKLSQEANDAGG